MDGQKKHIPSLYKGIGYMLVAWLFFTCMTLITRYVSTQASIGTILFFQNIIGLCSLIPWLIKHGWGLIYTKRLGLLFFRALVSVTAIGFSFLAVQRTSLVDTMLFNNSSPLWLPFVIWIGLKIPIRHILWPGLLGGFFGILLVLQPGLHLIQVGSLFAIVSGILQSINMVALRRLSYTERNHTIMFYYFLICSLVCFPLFILEPPHMGLIKWNEMLLIGLFLTLGQWCFVRAFHHAKPSQLGPFCYSAVIYSALIDWILYKDTPNFLAWIGIVLICFGGIWAIRFSAPKENIK